MPERFMHNVKSFFFSKNTFFISSYGIQKVYIGGYNFKEYIRATFSSCGSFIFCGTENGVVHVWSTETGKRRS